MRQPYKILLASDLHGSSKCFQKCIALALELEVSALVIAGDWSGKQYVVVEKQPDGAAICTNGTDKGILIGADQCEDYLRQWRDCGVYPIVVEEGAELTKQSLAQRLQYIRCERLRQWLEYGRRRTADANMECICIPGNDDDEEISALLSGNLWLHNVDLSVRRVDGFDFFGFGFSNLTPWGTPRELPESDIADKLQRLATRIADWRRAIGIIHVPPWNSTLDLAPELEALNETIPRVTGMGYVPVGSVSVRQFIESKQPAAVLSGHCHESAGVTKIGQTVCCNPGSQYHVAGLMATELLLRDSEVWDHMTYIR